MICNENLNLFKRDICEVFVLYKRALKETQPKKIVGIVELIGLNFLFFSEFVMSVVWYMENLDKNGEESDILDAIRLTKEFYKYFPSSPYLFFVLKKMLDFLINKQFYNYSSDFIYGANFINSVVNELQHIPEDKLEILQHLCQKIDLQKYEYLVYTIINNLSQQIFSSINNSKALLYNQNAPKEVKIISLFILIYVFNNLQLEILKEKYIKIFKNQFSEYISILEKYNLA